MRVQKTPFSYKRVAKYLILLLASLTLLDMILPGQPFKSVIVKININYEPYFNAAGNGHDSYAVVTEEHRFFIDQKDKEDLSEGHEINYRISPIFKEIQYYKSENIGSKIPSIRLFSGVFIPIFSIVIIGLSFRFSERLSIASFVCQVATLANLVYLLN